MTFRLLELRRICRDGTIEETQFDPTLTLLVGPSNSSKTTTLRMIDYCLGNDDPREKALWPTVATSYVGLELSFEMTHGTHTLRRALDESFGRVGKIEVDQEELVPSDFQSWLMKALDWPETVIPKGRNPLLAFETQRLTFRALLRHMYRREGSWLDFASGEEEYLRRAVLSFFLGSAASTEQLGEYRVGEATRRRDAAAEKLRDVTESGRQFLSELSDSLSLDDLRPETLDEAEAAVRSRVAEYAEQRARLQTQLESTPGFDAGLSIRYQTATDALQGARARESELAATVDAYVGAEHDLEAQTLRLERARESVEVFSEIPVAVCPACGSAVQTPVNLVDSSECYVCHHEVKPDARERRIDLEKLALGRERAELREVADRTRGELGEAEALRLALESDLIALRAEMDRRRANLIAPHVTELESLSRLEGAGEQQLATLGAARNFLRRQQGAAAALESAVAEVEQAEVALSGVSRERLAAHKRCSKVAERMTGFLRHLKSSTWTFGDITLAEEGLSFYVGREPWQYALGSEAKTLFFLAYHSGLMRLARDFPGEAHSPPFTLLDNPLQQGIDISDVARALDQLAMVAQEEGKQLVVTSSKDLPLSESHQVVHFTRQYAPES